MLVCATSCSSHQPWASPIPTLTTLPKLTLHSQKLCSWFFFISHTFRNFYKRSSHLPHFHSSLHWKISQPQWRIATHDDAQRHTATHTHTIIPVDGDHNDAHPGLDFIICCVVFVCFFIFFYAYGFYWLVVMVPSSASVIVVDRRLFWGFNNDRNDAIAIAFSWWSSSIWLLSSNLFSCVLFYLTAIYFIFSLI